MSGELPLEFLTDMAEAAIGLHEMFASFMAGGFTEGQALKLLSNIVTNIGNLDDD